MTQIFQTNITVMQDADGTKEIFTVPTENGKKVLTMAEYIEREDLLELYRMDDPVLNKNGHVPLPVIRKNIMDIPAADVAPVVRCKECKWAGGDFVCYRGEMVQHKPEDFCSYGERRGGGEDD